MNLQEIKQLDEQYFMGVFGERFDPLFTHGKGMYLYDDTGKQYLDFLAGIAVNCLGYGDAGFVKTVSEQVGKFAHISNYFYNETQSKLAKLLADLTGMKKVFFSNSGAESNECALKLAKKASFNRGEQRIEFIALKGSFHGRTLATLAATGQERFHTPFTPLMSKFTYVEPNNIEEIKRAVTQQTCGVILECILGEGGVIELTPEYLHAVREACDKAGALLIIDEIQTGMGRTGCFLCCQNYGIKPDIVTLAKAIAGGIPMGAVLAGEAAADAFAPGDHGSTFGGNHLACAAAYYVVNAILDRQLISNCREMGAYFKEKLNELKKYPFVLDVRGQGLMLGVQLAEDHPVMPIRRRLLSRGYVICSAGQNTLRFLPPYIAEKQHIDELAGQLDDVLKEA